MGGVTAKKNTRPAMKGKAKPAAPVAAQEEEDVTMQSEESEKEDMSSSEESNAEEASSSDSDSDAGHQMGRKAMFKRQLQTGKEKSQPKAKKAKTTVATKEKETAATFKNRQRVLVVASRGVTERHRHLQKDLLALLPHAYKEAKMDAKDNLQLLHEIADLSNCNNIMYLEARKHQDLYMWLSKSPSGPSVKCLVENISTMNELSLHGNCLKGSRPILSFDQSFGKEPHLRLMQELLTQMYGTPKGHRGSKPFFDHIMTFTVMDGQRIWVRHYQMQQPDQMDAEEGKEMTLTEIGPRFVLHLVRIFEGGFGGPTLWQNGDYVSPNEIRQMTRKETGSKYADRKRVASEHANKVRDLKQKEDELDLLFKTS